MGMDKDAARSGIRLTLGATTTDDEVDRVLDVVPGLVDGLRH